MDSSFDFDVGFEFFFDFFVIVGNFWLRGRRLVRVGVFVIKVNN